MRATTSGVAKPRAPRAVTVAAERAKASQGLDLPSTAVPLPAAVCHVAHCQQELEAETDPNYCLQCKLWLCEGCREGEDCPSQHDPVTHTLVLWAEREAGLSASVAMQALEDVRESSMSASTAGPAPSPAAASTVELKEAKAVVVPAPARADVVTADDLVWVLERLGGQCSKAKLAHALLDSASGEGPLSSTRC